MTAGIRRPGLLSHAFFTAEQARRDGTDAQTALTELWRQTEDLGIVEPVFPHWPTDLPDHTEAPATSRFSVLAARQRSGDGVYQALAYHLNDVVGFGLMQAPEDDAISWPDLHDRVHQTVGTTFHRGIMGTVTARFGLWPALRAVASESVQSIAAHAAIPGDWTRSWFRPADGLLLWELPPPGHSPVTLARRLLVLADALDEELLDQWIWGSAPGLPTLTRYLLHAAKLRYHGAYLNDTLHENKDSAEKADAQCAKLALLLDNEDVSVGRLLQADRDLGRLQTDTHGLITRLTRVRDMSNTVEIAQENIAAALGSPSSSAVGGPVDNDLQVARWTREQLRAEEAYLASAQLRVTETAHLTTIVVTSRLQQRKEQLTLLQSTLIGGLIMVLAAIQSLEYSVPLGGPLKAPLVYLLGAAALLLPSVLLPYPRHILGRPWTGYFVMGSFGAAAGWFTATIVVHLTQHRPAPPLLSVLAALAFTTLALLLAPLHRLVGRLRNRPPAG